MSSLPNNRSHSGSVTSQVDTRKLADYFGRYGSHDLWQVPPSPTKRLQDVDESGAKDTDVARAFFSGMTLGKIALGSR